MPGISLASTPSSDIMPEQIVTIFSSKSLKRKIIEKYDLYEHYKMKKNANKFENTCKILDKSLLLESDELGSLGFSKTISFSLSAYHTSRDTACQMVMYSFDLLDSAVKAISSDRAHQNRVFIEKQLERNKTALDSLQDVMREFQIKNKAYNVPEQVKMTIKAYADVKAAMLANEIRMKSIYHDFAGETPELASLQKSNLAFKEKLAQIETLENPDVMPSLESSTKLMPQYANLMQDIEVQDQLILLVTRELEQAKIKEVKNISGLIVSDPAYVPEYKARPKRMTIMALLVSIYMTFIFSVVIMQEIYRISLKDSSFVKAVRASLKNKAP
jgi:capsule polysaccharide export protein KpsE/RkpR